MFELWRQILAEEDLTGHCLTNEGRREQILPQLMLIAILMLLLCYFVASPFFDTALGYVSGTTVTLVVKVNGYSQSLG